MFSKISLRHGPPSKVMFTKVSWYRNRRIEIWNVRPQNSRKTSQLFGVVFFDLAKVICRASPCVVPYVQPMPRDSYAKLKRYSWAAAATLYHRSHWQTFWHFRPHHKSRDDKHEQCCCECHVVTGEGNRLVCSSPHLASESLRSRAWGILRILWGLVVSLHDAVCPNKIILAWIFQTNYQQVIII